MTNPCSAEPLAIVGIGCRFPGSATDVTRFWQLVQQGIDTIVEVPQDRWDTRRFFDEDTERPGKSYVKEGGFLEQDIQLFDPLFFGITPREAETLDPQQRLMLETVWEAVEDAGFRDDTLKGSRTGVFLGAFTADSTLLRLGPLNREAIDAHTPTSSTFTILSNRIAYVLDLHGPALTIDTACSSSLVAIHHAAQSIWRGESDMAIAGGVNIMLRPEYFIAMSKGKFLSPHGRCMAFDERAAGYARGEGAGAVILKPVSQARADGDTIWALLRATAVNQDGLTAGISQPNGAAQEALIREVLAQTDAAIHEIRYVEAHGTGTRAGDPIELAALDRVLSAGVLPEAPPWVNSVKTNIGHLEAASGVAGFLRSILTLHHGQVGPNIHFKEPNPDLQMDTLCLRVPTQVEPLRGTPGRIFSMVNSFGYGGTNAHAVLQDNAVTDVNREAAPDRTRPFLISAKNEEALKALADRTASSVESTAPCRLDDLCYSMAYRRSRHNERLVVVAREQQDLVNKLLAYGKGHCSPGVFRAGVRTHSSQKLAFVYTGMGPQWFAMGQRLLETEPAYAEAAQQVDEAFQEVAGWSLLVELSRSEKASKITRTDVAQPANFLVQTSLTALWRSWGIEPSAVVGHSVGEVSAAFAAGVLDLHDAVTVSFHRSRLQQSVAGSGTMMAVGLSEDELAARLPADVSVAAINSRRSVTVAGPTAALVELQAVLQSEQVFCRILAVEVPYHSPGMDPLRDEALHVFRSLQPREAQIPLYSTVTANPLPGQEWNKDYWWKNIRQPVRFGAAVQQMLADGYSTFVEVGPHPVLTRDIKEGAQEAGVDVTTIASMKRNRPEPETTYEALGAVVAANPDVIGPEFTGKTPQYVKLPKYPWQRERYWVESEISREDRLGRAGHPLVSGRLAHPNPAWEVEFNHQFFPWAKDHAIGGHVVFPAAGYVEAALVVHAEYFETTACRIEQLQFHQMLLYRSAEIRLLSTHLDPQSLKLQVMSRDKSHPHEWRMHATGRILPQAVTNTTRRIDLDRLCANLEPQSDVSLVYHELSQRGLDYGPAFRGMKQLWASPERVVVDIELSAATVDAYPGTPLHPALLDAAFQALIVMLKDNPDQDGLPFVPVSIEQLTLYRPAPAHCISEVRLVEFGTDEVRGDLDLYNQQGTQVASIRGLVCKAAPAMVTSLESDRWHYVPRWIPSPASAETTANPSARTWLLVSDGAPPLPLSQSEVLEFDAICHAHNGQAGLVQVGLPWQNDDPLHVAYFFATSSDAPGLAQRYSQLTQCIRELRELVDQRQVHLYFLSEDAWIVSEGDRGDGLDAAPLASLAHVIENEHPTWTARAIDRGHNVPWSDVLTEMLSGPAKDKDVALRSAGRFVLELQHAEVSVKAETAPIEEVTTHDSCVKLEQSAPGLLDTFSFQQIPLPSPGREEVLIENVTTALNYKDLLKVYDRLDQSVLEGTYFQGSFGMEVAGIVRAVGSAVHNVKVGDEVIAPVRGSFCSFVLAEARYVIPKPPNLPFEKAPVVIGFMTAWHGLRNIARIQAGEHVLIHNATGGVGLPALQIARASGAVIHATAGNDVKRDWLRKNGIEHVYDSRSLQFVDQVRQATNGRGVDVVLNAISGPALFESFRLLAPYGRFVELGKSEISKDVGLPMGVFNRNITFAAIDVDRMFRDNEALTKSLLREFGERMADGTFAPLETTTFPAAEVDRAFRLMAQSEHIGKVVVRFQHQSLKARKPSEPPCKVQPNRSYLVSGGNAGFGLTVAEHLAAQGAGRLVLISRSGLGKEGVERVAKMRESGTQVESLQLDVTDEQALSQVVQACRNADMPLRGVVHSAMVLDDGPLVELDLVRFERVLRPKVDGALALHRSTQNEPLDFFVNFSSISALVGNATQANYVVANAFLEHFATWRRRQGLPCSTISWGVLSESGVVTRNEAVGKQLQRTGIRGLSDRQAMLALPHAMDPASENLGWFDIDWKTWASTAKASTSSRFAAVIDAHPQEQSEQLRQALAFELLLAEEGAQTRVLEMLVQALSHLLRLAADRIDPKQGINELGLDSLMTVELAAELRKIFHIDVSAADLLNSPSAEQLTEMILPRVVTSKDVDALSVDDMSEEQLDALLATHMLNSDTSC